MPNDSSTAGCCSTSGSRDGRAVAGKADWGSAGLPLEGENDSTTRAAAHARTDVPRCRLDESLQTVRRRVGDAGWEICFVVDAGGVVIGGLGRRAFGSDDDLAVASR